MPIDHSLDRRTLIKLGTAAAAAFALPASAGAAPSASTAPRARSPDAPVLLIRGATVITLDPHLGDLPGADVLIKHGVIVGVGKGLHEAGAEVLDARGMILIPGLVDAHWHLWNSFLRSSAPTPAGEPFFKQQLANAPRFTPERSALGVRLGLAQAVASGITTVNNWSHNLRSPAFAQAELAAMRDSGLRGRFWYGYAQDAKPDAPMDFDDILKVQAQLQTYAPGQLDLGLAIRGPERTEPTIWEPEFAFARQHRLPISTHIAVTAQMQQKKALQQLAQRGLLDASVQLVHATHVDAQDVRSIADSGASVCLTPLTEMRVGYGLAPIAPLAAAKIPLSLGIDTLVLSGNANLFMVMQTLLNLATGMTGNEQQLTARDVLYIATQGGATAMGLGAVTGSITVGKRADLALIDARGLDLLPVLDPVAAVVQGATPASVDTVIADGQVLKRGGRLTRVDTTALAAELTQTIPL